MSVLTGPFPATNELVAIAWLTQRVDGLAPGQVATALPRKTESWYDEGFVQARMLSGRTAMVDIPVRVPVLTIDCWATPTDGKDRSSARPPWNKANRLVELIRAATEDPQIYGRPVTMPDGYSGARVQSVYFITEPVRIEGDPGGYARFSFDLAIDWVRS